MNALKQYSIPVHRLGIGVHEFSFDIGWSFFKLFEESPIQQGRFDVIIKLDKHTDHWQTSFSISGILDTDCDRCLAPIALPVSGEFGLLVKFEDELMKTNSHDVIYLDRESLDWNIAQYIYEFILLSIPVSRTFNCGAESSRPCDDEMLNRLKLNNASEQSNPVWEVLKQIEKKN